MKNIRMVLYPLIFFAIMYIPVELAIRAALAFYGYPFFKPGNYLYTGFYTSVSDVIQKDIKNNDDTKDILILGGSVISTPWSHMEVRLDTILKNRYGKDKKLAIYNVAGAGHSSLDNLIKYQLLERKHFDLVIYYEAINENRANCIPKEFFKEDYTHLKWYRDIQTILSHPEINYTVLPYVFHLTAHKIKDILTHRYFASFEKVEPGFMDFGSQIKTAKSYEKNLSRIIDLAEKKGEKLILMKYASFFPKGIALSGEEMDKKHFAGCYYACSVSIWGKAGNVEKGITVHNQILENLARKRHTYYLDMQAEMPQNPAFFCDICHVSEPGARHFANRLASYIIDQKLVE
jgi:hypothetical protein